MLHAAVLMTVLFLPGQSLPVGSVHTLSMDQAATHALAAKPGMLLGSARIVGHQRPKYVFNIQAPEGIWKVKVDAGTGQVSRACLLDVVGPHGCGLRERRHGTRIRATNNHLLASEKND